MPPEATRDELFCCADGRNGSCSPSSCAVTVRVLLLREHGRSSTSGGTVTAVSCSCIVGTAGGGGTRVALKLRRLAARRRRDWERARVRVGAVSHSDSVSEEAGEGESPSISRSSSVHVWWPAAATRESGLGCGRAIENAPRVNACVVGDRPGADGRELRSFSLPLESESSSVPSPTWRNLGEAEVSFD